MGYNTSSSETLLLGEDYYSTILFFATLISSIISASLGLAKGLLYGVARTLSADGFADGVLSGRFLAASLASGSVLISRAAILALHAMVNLFTYKRRTYDMISAGRFR